MNGKKIHTFVVLAYKTSEYLEQCICSVLHQSYDSNVVIATSTPSDFIQHMADKYQIELIVNPKPAQGIGYDFDFARNCANSKLVTIAHQDDIYDEDYSREIVNAYKRMPDSLILFPDYYEIRGKKKVYGNVNLNIKKILLFPLRCKRFGTAKLIKRFALAFGSAIGCPSVTFVNDNIQQDDIFSCDLKCNIDWNAWERLSKKKGRFTYIHYPLMGHRVHEESTTTEILKDNIRTKEDFIILCRFWPKPIARFIARIYSLSEKSNEVVREK